MVSWALSHFPTLSNKRHDFRGTVIKYEIAFALSLQLLSETFLILRIIQ